MKKSKWHKVRPRTYFVQLFSLIFFKELRNELYLEHIKLFTKRRLLIETVFVVHQVVLKSGEDNRITFQCIWIELLLTVTILVQAHLQACPFQFPLIVQIPLKIHPIHTIPRILTIRQQRRNILDDLIGVRRSKMPLQMTLSAVAFRT